MVKIAFHDTTDTLPNSSQGGWAKFGVRRLFHYAVDIMAKVYPEADSVKKVLWAEDSFIEILGRAMQGRRTGEDTSAMILWRTDDKRCIRYEHLKAMIVGNNIHSASVLPSRKRKITTSFDFPQVEDSNRPKDTFFKWLVIRKGEYQLNDILFGRICFCISKKFPENKNANVPSWKAYYSNIRMVKAVNLGLIWDTSRRFEKALKEYQKKIVLKKVDRSACEVNSGSWRYPPSGGIYPFSYLADDEAEMDQYLASGNYVKAIEFALKGYLTESFLAWLVEMKIYYNSVRDQGLAGKVLFLKNANLPI
jgi:hypothetical protein